jgi:hypothetical protein
MGLTIHYSLRSAAATVSEARSVVGKLRDYAKSLPFLEVGQIVEMKGQNVCECERRNKDNPHRWLLTQATQPIRYTRDGEERWEAVSPQHVIAFSVDPGDGCEQANFGLCRYPGSISTSGRRIRTGLGGWYWASFCKTQYASNPTCGGVPNFLRCHIGVIRLLDNAKELGLLDAVKDEGHYWEKRDVPALLKEIDQWNVMIAGAFGAMKDTLESMGQNTRALVAEIAKFPNFEHLEAEGRLKSKGE